MPVSFLRSHRAPLSLLFLVCLAFWSRVLFTGQVLLPGEMLRGFAPFGDDPRAPWTILQWDALSQYFPWRHLAAQKLQGGEIPLWNPFQFCGTPFLANAQSAVFYPLNWPFWVFDTASAFGLSAFLHSLLASFSTYFLARRWNFSRAAAVLSAISYAFCGYLSAWALLPTLFSTASWLPLCLLLFEKASDDENPGFSSFWLSAALACALLAGHAQIFFYIVLALGLRQPFLKRSWRGLAVWLGSLSLGALLSAIQILPTLELAKRGHRAGGAPTLTDWQFWQPRALQPGEFPSLFLSNWPMNWGTLNENFGYVGLGALILALAGIFGLVAAFKARKNLDFPHNNSETAPSVLPSRPAIGAFYAPFLTLFGLFYALATPVARFFFFGVPGVSQMGGTGRALLLWSLGIALLAGLGLDFGRRHLKNPVLPWAALLLVSGELFFNAFSTQPTAPRRAIYPPTPLTTFLAKNSGPKARVLFWTPQKSWLPTEVFGNSGRTHPPGVLPPNGASVYGIYDVNGYDSLSPRVYRDFIGSEGTPSPQLNGNMVLLNSLSAPLLDSLSVRYVVTRQQDPPAIVPGKKVLSAQNCEVWERQNRDFSAAATGESFYPGWKDGKYQPETFRLGAFISLCALGFLVMVGTGKRQCFAAKNESVL